MSFLDLSSNSNQPIKLDEPFSAFVFNGEIFNFQDFGNYKSDTLMLKYELEKALKSIDFIGSLSKLLNKFNGFFSIVVKYNGSLIFIRDRFGEKPHYLYSNGKGLVSASEIKAIKEVVALEIQEESLKRLSLNPFSFKDSKISKGLYDTCYKHVYELKPGNIALYSASEGLKSIAWYDLNGDINSFKGCDTTDLYLDALKIRTDSDVPGCFTLSGGVDSTANCIAAKENKLVDISTFSLISASEQYSEKDEITVNASTINIKNTLINESDYLESIKAEDVINFISHFDTPYFDPNIAQFYLYSKIRETQFKYVIDGHGADELLSGYQWHFPNLFFHSLATLKIKDALALARYFFKAYPDNYSTIYKLSIFFKGVFKASIDKSRSYFGYKCDKASSIRFQEVFSQVMLRLLNNYDTTSMKSSIETRTPFLDYRLVANILSKDISFFIGDKNKPWLRGFIFDNTGLEIMDKKIGLRSYIWDSLKNDCIDELFSFYAKALKSGNFKNLRVIDKKNIKNLSPSQEQVFWKLVSYQVIKDSV